MKATTFDSDAIAVDVTAPTGVIGAMQRLLAAVSAAAEARQLRSELANLDPHLLRDIGIADDEVARVKAREVFVPRAWHD